MLNIFLHQTNRLSFSLDGDFPPTLAVGLGLNKTSIVTYFETKPGQSSRERFSFIRQRRARLFIHELEWLIARGIKKPALRARL